jgi:hypothetical protein
VGAQRVLAVKKGMNRHQSGVRQHIGGSVDRSPAMVLEDLGCFMGMAFLGTDGEVEVGTL